MKAAEKLTIREVAATLRGQIANPCDAQMAG